MSPMSPPTSRQAIQSHYPSGFNIQTISKLSNDEIRGSMTRVELMEVIRSVDYPFASKDRLQFFDRDTLERVVCLVRRYCCRVQ